MTTILTKKKDTAGAPAPGDLTNSAGGAELAVNTFDKRLYTKDAGGNVVEIGTNPSAIVTTSITDSGNLTFTGTGNRITGDFSNATVANRVAIQTSTTNGNTAFFYLPNGTSQTANAQFHNASDPTNAANMLVGVTSSDATLRSGITGTGTYLPITLYTGGSERLRIDTSGNVGIGTSSPTAGYGPLQFAGGASGSLISTTDAGLNIAQYNGEAYLIANATLSAGGSWTARATTSSAMSARNGFIVFSTNSGLTSGNAFSPTERMRIDSSGNVGIGGTPNAFANYTTVAINGADSYLEFQRSGSRQLTLYTTSTTSVIGNITSTPLVFFTTNAERMRITAAGDVAIGSTVVNTTTNYTTLEVSGTNGGFLNLSTNGSLRANIYGNSGGLSFNAFGSGNTYFYSSNTERMRLTSAGYLGINTISPLSQLDVVGPSGRTSFTGTAVLGVTVQGATSTNDYSGIDFSTNGNTPRARIAAYYSSSGSYLQFGTSNSYVSGITNTAMTIDYLGNVGIGTTAAFGASNRELSINTASGVAGVSLGVAGALTGFLYSGTSATALGSYTSTPLTFITANTERMRIDSSGNLLVGTTNANAQAGNGTKFLDSGQLINTVAAYTASSSSNFVMYSTGAGTYRFYVGWDGTIRATSTTISAISDQRLKENVRDLDTGLDAIMAVKPRRFDWKEGKGQDKKDAVGFIAQEFETVFPASVTPSLAGEDGIEYKTICHEELIPTLVKAIQEQQVMIEELKAKVAALEAK